MTQLLSDSEYLALLPTDVEPRDEDAEPPFDFWPYVDAIPSEHFRGHDCSPGTVTYAFRHPRGRYEHVLVDSTDADVFMVLVLDLHERRVVGHLLLDMLSAVRDATSDAATAPCASVVHLRLCIAE
jgi:hypothetical protein